MDLDKLAEEIRSVNRANGWRVFSEIEHWNDPHKVPAILALIHSEVSEALEAFREDDREHVLEEMADVVIRVLDFVGGFDKGGCWFESIITEKIEKNRQRGYRHGHKRL